jgi:hypothetical protein
LKIWLTIAPAAHGSSHLEVAATSSGVDPLPPDTQVLVTFLRLDEPLDVLTSTLTAGDAGLYTAEDIDLDRAGWWQVHVIVRRPGRPAASTTFPLKLGAAAAADERRSVDPEAARLFAQAQATWASVRTWREAQQLTDGAGSAYTTWLEAERPDRQHFRTSSGVEVVVLGKARYQRSGDGRWRRYEFSNAIPVEGPLYFMRGARGITAGRTWPCNGETCRALLWTSPDGGAQFAAWVGMRSRLVRAMLMIEPTHYMTLQYSHINGPVRVQAPLRSGPAPGSPPRENRRLTPSPRSRMI